MSGESIKMDITGRQQQKAQTRDKIIKTAYRVFSQSGFLTPTSVIAKEAGISHGTIFAHFATLDDLLVCLLDDFGQKMGISMHYLANAGGGIKDLLEKHLEALAQFEAFYSRLISEMNLLPNEAKSTFVMIQSAAAKHFCGVIEKETENGNVKKIPVHMLFNTWMGLIHYYLQNSEFFSMSYESVLERHKKELTDTFMNLIYIKNEV